jgi:Putative Actinobacterial Holin-X, holin superfamily III
MQSNLVEQQNPQPDAQPVHIPAHVPALTSSAVPLTRTAEIPTQIAVSFSTAQLLAEISRDTERLLKDQVALAKAELRAELSRQASQMMNGVGASALVVLAGMNLLLMTAVLALARTVPAWEAGLLTTALLWLVAALAAVRIRRGRRRA